MPIFWIVLALIVVFGFNSPAPTRYVIAAVVALLGLSCIVVNFVIIFRYLRHQKTSSLVPLVGGVLFAVGMVMTLQRDVCRWAWVPLAIDPGGVWLFGTFLLGGWRSRR